MNEHLSKAVSDLTGLLVRLAGPLSDELGAMIGDKGREYRIKNAVKIFERVRSMLSEAGISPDRLPARLFMPLVEAASLEDDETLQERWAANASNPAHRGKFLPSFINTLKEITPEQATFLEAAYQRVTVERLSMGSEIDVVSLFTGKHQALVGSAERKQSLVLIDDLVHRGLIERSLLGEKALSQ